MAFDTANQSNRCMRPIWLGVIRSLRDIGCMMGLLYNHSSIRWLILRKIRTSSMRVVQVSIACRKDNSFEGIYLPGLESIRVDSGCDMKDSSVRMIAAECVSLLSIEMAGCSQLTWKSFKAVGQHCRGLTLLDISGCIKIVDKAVRLLAKGCIHLQSINIASCPQLTDAALAAIGQSCKGLTSIDISHSIYFSSITTAIFISLVEII